MKYLNLSLKLTLATVSLAELFRKHLQQTNQRIDVEEVRANVRKEDRIIDTLEPVLNQHRLVVDRSVIEWDFKSNPDDST